MAKQNYSLHLKGYVGGWDFDADYVDYILAKNADKEVHVLIDSLGGSLAKALPFIILVLLLLAIEDGCCLR